MIQNKVDFINYLKADKKALGISEKTKKFSLTYKIWKFEILLRKLEYEINTNKYYKYSLKYYFLKIRYQRLSIKYGFFIPCNCFGKGLSIAHIGPIIINGNVKIGENCRIHVGVNIGTEAGYGDRCPVIGNNVYIAPGAKVFGKISIADGIVIGSNAVVNKSFYEKEIAIAGVPAKKISNNGRNVLDKKGQKKGEI